MSKRYSDGWHLNRRWTLDKMDQMTTWRRKGLGVPVIAFRFGVSEAEIYQILEECGDCVPVPRETRKGAEHGWIG